MNNAGLNFTICKIADGDSSAQAELHDLVYTPLVQYIARGFRSSFSAEDIEEIALQSILLIFVNASKYRGKAGESSAWKWAYTIARNQALKWLKAGKREISFSDAGGNDNDPDIGVNIASRAINNPHLNRLEDGVEDQVIERMFLERARELFQGLDDRERKILALRFDEGWTLKKIAAHLNLTPARITQILQGILQKFRNDPGLSFQSELI